MGKLLIGHYGKDPEAESIEIPLRDCHQRLGMKPSDFVSAEPPSFFRKAHGALGKYLVFLLDASETQNSIWKPGYYLLPLEAADVLKVFGKGVPGEGAPMRPTQIESKGDVPAAVLARATRWSEQSQPLLFSCHCPELVLRLDPPSLFRKTWRARLTCPKRCQPPLRTLL